MTTKRKYFEINIFSLISIEWNCINGFSFKLIHFDMFLPVNIDSSLFGLSISSQFIYIDVLWFSIKIFDKNLKS